jgi:hypothetical protein
VKHDPQKHLEDSRAQIQRDTSSSNLSPSDALDEQSSHRSALRDLSNASSSASSFSESYENSLRQPGQDHPAPGGSSFEPSPSGSNVNLSRDETPPHGTPGTEPMFNFQSLTEAITPEEESEKDGRPQFIENVGGAMETSSSGQHASTSNEVPVQLSTQGLEDSTLTLKPVQPTAANHDHSGDEIEPAPRIEAVQNGHSDFDQKHVGEVSMMNRVHHQATQ